MRKLLSWLNDHTLRIDVGLFITNELFLIPTISIHKVGRYLETYIHILCIDIYACYSINYYKDEP